MKREYALIRMGRFSLAIVLPRRWIKKLGLKARDHLTVTTTNQRVTITAKGKEAGKR